MTDVNIGSAMRSLTLSVRIIGIRRLRARLWLATRLIALAALIAGCNIEVGTDAE